MVRVRAALFVASIAAASTIGAGARAADDPRAQSRALFTSGAAALDDGRPSDALRAFESAYALFPHYATLYNIGLCERALGHPLEASTSFRKFLDDGGDAIAAEQRATAERLLRESEARVAVVRFTAPPSARLVLDGRAIEGASARLDPGSHVVEGSADGYAPRRVSFDADAGGRPVIDLGLARASEPRPVAPAKDAAATPPDGESRSDAKVWVSAGIAGAALMTGVVCGVIALGDSHVYNDPATSDDEAARRKSRGQTLRIVADASFGLAILAGGAALWFATRPSNPPAPQKKSWIAPAPWVSERGAGLALHGAWPSRLF